MNANSTYSIGHDHTICEDYSIGEVWQDIAYAIVSDGCSASENVDMGARVMAMSAKRELRWNENVDDCNFFGDAVIRNAKRIFDIFPYLNSHTLDATLLVAMVSDNKLAAIMYGDGVLVHKTKIGTNVVHISLTSGAPDYLSYHLDNGRRVAYDKLEDNNKEVTIKMAGTGNVVKTITKPFDPYVLNMPVEPGDVIAVISDGINSFRKSDYTPIPWEELVDEFTGFKNFEGEFVLRRIAAFKRKCIKEGWTFSDDISIASIHV